ncbi:MAG: site-2 protease family protein [Chloroflexi bacterium]|nr:site-2 protease family protein [Chloroflexota bacterium]
MSGSLKLFTVRGIDVRLHLTFPLILLWAAFQFGAGMAGAVFGVTAVSLLFVLITLHELGHSFAAQHYGVPVKQIILSPIGGVAQLARMPEKPSQEFIIAIAGPAVNFVIAGLMWGAATLLDINLGNALYVLVGNGGVSLSALFSYIFVYNIFLAVFNLLPAFPMDGGRVFRSLLAMRLDYVRATKIAATVGRGVAILMGVYGLFNGAFFMVLVAIFIYGGATQEERMTQVRGSLRGYTVQQSYSPSVYQLSPYHNLQHVMDFMLMSGQSSFPVSQGELYVGFLTRGRLEQALQTRARHTWVSDVMRRDVRPVGLMTSIYEVLQRLDEEQLNALPVVENASAEQDRSGRCLGIITRRNIQELYRLSKIAPGSFPKVKSV